MTNLISTEPNYEEKNVVENLNLLSPQATITTKLYENVANALIELPNWVIATNKKLPFNPQSGKGAKSNDCSNWNSFDSCLNYLKKNYGKAVTIGNQSSEIAGLGFMFCKDCGLVGIDIDHCLNENGVIIDDRVQRIVDSTTSYAEISCSGTGIHIITRAQKNFSSNKIHLTKDIALEVYDTARYFFITGNILDDKHTKVTEDQALLDNIGKEFFFTNIEADDNNIYSTDIYADCENIPEEVIERLDSYLTTDSIFRRRWYGERFKGDESSDDMALLFKLAKIADGNIEFIQALFLSSPYFASKDEHHKAKVQIRKDYITRSINKAVEYCGMDLEPEDITLLEYDFTDDGNADRFLYLYGDNVSYCTDENTWYVFNGHFWEADVGKNHIMKLSKELASKMKLVADAFRKHSDSVDKQFLQSVKRLGNMHAKQSMISACQCEVAREKKDYNIHRDILTVHNGVVNLRTGELLPFSAEYFSTQAIRDIDYNPSNDEPTRFLRFLNEIFNSDKELINYVLRFLGYCLTGEVKESKFLICYGSGANGKSVFFNLVRDIMGFYADSMAAAGILKKRNNDGPNTNIMRIRDTRMVTIEELKRFDELDTALVKNITGGTGEKINVREMYGRAQSFEIAFKLVMNTNFLPRLDWIDYAIERRVVVIPFNVVFSKEKQDKDLPSKLREEKEQILNLLIKNAVEYYKYGLPEIPEACKQAFKKATVADCPLKAYFDEEIEITRKKSDKIQAQSFYDGFKQWCACHDIAEDYIDSQASIGRRVRFLHGVETKTDGYHRVQYCGMKFKNSTTELTEEPA